MNALGVPAPSATASIDVGPFRLIAPIGRGGMGEVWRGEHRAQRTGVAVKVLTSERARSARSVAAFRAEVRAVAALSHPAVVWVFDQSLISDAAARASGDRLPAGSPALAMELAEHTADPLCGRLPWAGARAILEAVLQGLGHAHARGVIHRDIKPANVLIGGTRPGARLSDFGLAWSGGLEDDGGLGLSGTPAYMAPEQLEGDWRATGPWTDLYGLGGLAWALLTGSPPHGRVDLIGARAAARRGQFSDFEPRMSTPRGLEEWVRRLLEPEPSRRFTRAADAAWALAQLGEPVELGPRAPQGGTWRLHPPPTPPSIREVQTESWVPSFSISEPPAASADSTGLRWQPDEDLPAPPLRRGAPLPAAPRPPFPASWREDSPLAGATPAMLGAGLGLFGLRAVPLVGRDHERDRLWSGLAAAAQAGEPRLVLLRGGAGVGKSALVRWLGERAHELGAATPLVAVHSPVPGAGDGVIPMVGRSLRVLGASRPEVRRLLTLRWPGLADEPDLLAEAIELLAGDGAEGRGELPDLPRVRLGSQRERHLALARLLARLAEDRPLILALEDVQWGLDALEFADFLLSGAGGRAMGVLLVLTAREDVLAERPDERARLSALVERSTSERLALGPLTAVEDRALVRQLLGFEPEDSLLLAERTAGNPLFAVQLVGDWVSRGIVEVGPQGFRLRTGADTSLPPDLAALGRDRLTRALADRPPDDRVALELAATLGQEVDEVEWAAACAATGVDPRPDWMNVLAERGVLRAEADRRAGGFGFVHGVLRESALAEAERHGRRRAHHATCACVLEARGRDAGRAGMHLLDAGRPDEAARLLELGVQAAIEERYVPRIIALVRAWRRALEEAGAAQDDPRWGELWLRECYVADQLGQAAEAAALATRLEEAAARHRWVRGSALALFRRAASARQRARPDEALPLLSRAAALMADDPEQSAQILSLEVQCHLELRAVEQASASLERLRDLVRRSGHPELALELLRLEALVHAAGDAPAPTLLACGERLLDAAQGAGSRLYEARARRILARALRHAGEPARAVGHLERAVVLSETLGTDFLTQLCWMDLAVAHVEQGEFERALLELQSPLGQSRRVLVQMPRTEGEARVWLGVALAGLSRWEEADAELARGLLRYREDQTLEADIPRALELASGLAERAGDRARARRWLLEAGHEQRRCGAEALAAELMRRADALP